MKLLQLKKIRVSELVSIIEINVGRRQANLSSARVVCSRSLSQQVSRPIGPSMTLGNMRELEFSG
jgi:predicted DNA-binding ribbon-helix-helix protein